MKKSKRLIKATAEHAKWLEKRGLDPKSLRQKLKHAKQWIDFPVYEYTKVEYSNIVGSGVKTGVMSALHKESKKVQDEILDKASRTMPLYNKGGLQYCTPETDIKMVGTKSRRS